MRTYFFEHLGPDIEWAHSAGKRLLDAAREAIRVARGESQPARVTTFLVCAECGNVTKIEGGKCFVCHPLKPA